MDELMLRIGELSAEGFGCSQIMVKLGLEMQDKENEDMMRALCGLRGGMATGRNCGTLTGGACLISLFSGSGEANKPSDPASKEMVAEFSDWFEENFGSADCKDLVGPSSEERKERCPAIMKESFEKCMQILYDHGYDPYNS